MTSATDELKSCPFCGGEASWIAARQREDGTYYPAACGCSKCGIRCYGESDYGHGGFATEEDRKVSMEQAVSKWNTRTPEQSIADELNAALGGGECEWTLKEKWPNRDGDDHVYGYETGCGARHTWWPDSLPNFCPTCGNKVKAVKR